jgi:hypothetical protein
MRRRPVFRVVPGFVTVCLLQALTPSPSQAQDNDGVRFGVGYVADAPELLGGGAAYIILPALGGVGLYVDAKFDLNSPTGESTFVESLTAREVEGQVSGAAYRDSQDSWRGLNIAVIRPMNESLMLYVGLGSARRSVYKEYRDPSGELGLLGILTVEDPEEEETKLNGMAGAFLRLSPLISVQTGFESTPAGFTVGASFRLPPR